MPVHRRPLPPLLRLLAIALAAASAAACGGQKEPEGTMRPAQIAPNDPDAERWLLNNAHPYGFANNRFAYTRFAVQFVRDLYAAGADTVVVDGTTIREKDYEEYPYAAALKVGLPADDEKRRAVLRKINVEWRRQNLPPERDTGARVVPLSWDKLPRPGEEEAKQEEAKGAT